jgi:hypothetical protein
MKQEIFHQVGRPAHYIYKSKGDKQDPANYRGISLLSTLSKVYMEVLARRLNDWIEKRGAVSECQMGFRKGRRTDDNTYNVPPNSANSNNSLILTHAKKCFK